MKKISPPLQKKNVFGFIKILIRSSQTDFNFGITFVEIFFLIKQVYLGETQWQNLQ